MIPRYVVRWWGDRLEETLQRNDHKPDWHTLPLSALFPLLLVEVAELAEALAGTDREHIRREAADVAAVAMFIADRVAERPSSDRGREVHYG